MVIHNESSNDLVFNTRNFQFGKQQDSLKAYKLKHSYYNMTEQGSTTYNSISKHLDNTRYNSCLAQKRAVKPTILTSRRQLGKIDILLLPAVGNLVSH
jgi:hypothetical protein